MSARRLSDDNVGLTFIARLAFTLAVYQFLPKTALSVVDTFEEGYGSPFQDALAFIGKISEQDIAAAIGQVHHASRSSKAVVEEILCTQLSNATDGARIVARYCDKGAGSSRHAYVVIGDTQRQTLVVGRQYWRQVRR